MLNDRHCVFFKNNGKNVKCKLDNSLRNCCEKKCPHYRPNIWMRIYRMLRHTKRKNTYYTCTYESDWND